MSRGVHPRSLVQTAVLLALLGLATYTTLLESAVGRAAAAVVVLVVAVDVVVLTWRRFGPGRS